MKIELVRENNKVTEFPCLMESEDGTVWLAFDAKSGVCVKDGSSRSSVVRLGSFSDCLAMWALKPVSGTVTFTS